MTLIMRNAILAALATALVAAVGCANTTFQIIEVDKPVYLTPPPEREGVEVLKHFEDEASAAWSLFGLWNLRKPNLDDVAGVHVYAAGGDAIANLKIHDETGTLRSAINVIGAPLFSRRTYRIEGDVIRLPSEKNHPLARASTAAFPLPPAGGSPQEEGPYFNR